ncbi:MAG TPA: HAMP domain-containing sensor histidine kinase [Micropepsaceae bacterium]|jgi:two-component system sensor histidine kinase ChvG|nr:HAMP domain-containing sensor histidine kinase [Micropepsaceae bacterium]
MFYRAFAIKIIFLAIIFLFVPIVFYKLFQIADAQQSALLQRTVEEKGNLVASVLQPRLEAFDSEPPERLQAALDQLLSNGTNIKVLARPEMSPATGGFLYVASAPATSADYLEQERDELIRLGIFDRLAPSCDGETRPTMRFTNPAGHPEILTSVSAMHAGKNCWVVITSQSTAAILNTSIGQPVWRTPIIRVAMFVYLLSAVVVAWLFVDIWRSIDRFRTAARKIRVHGAGEVTFREMNTIPELTGVADDFDSLVGALKQSKDFIIQAAEENAHALKAPLAVISQAIEPLKRAVPHGNLQAQRSLDVIERSITRLDLLVSAARDLEQAAADAIYSNSRPINLSAYLTQLIGAYQTTLTAEGKVLRSDIEPDVHAYATEEAMESIIENLLENAASFTSQGGTIIVTLKTSNAHAHLTIADDGPGVPNDNLPLIFERHFSARSQARESTNAPIPTDNHYGLGLWIVRRNVEGLGGRIAAVNRAGGGFAVTASFRAAA